MQEIKFRPISREVWEEREYCFEKSASIARCDFEAAAKILVGWDDEIEQEIKFSYMLNDTVVMVFVRERIE
jgi:hypothetical protein